MAPLEAVRHESEQPCSENGKSGEFRWFPESRFHDVTPCLVGAAPLSIKDKPQPEVIESRRKRSALA